MMMIMMTTMMTTTMTTITAMMMMMSITTTMKMKAKPNAYTHKLKHKIARFIYQTVTHKFFFNMEKEWISEHSEKLYLRDNINIANY